MTLFTSLHEMNKKERSQPSGSSLSTSKMLPSLTPELEIYYLLALKSFKLISM